MLPKKGKVLPKGSRGKRTGLDFNKKIAVALRAELGSTHQAVKTVMRWTGASERTVKNWLDGAHGPSGDHFIVLVRHSDEVLKAVLTMAGRGSALVSVKNLGTGDMDADIKEMRSKVGDLGRRVAQYKQSKT